MQYSFAIVSGLVAVASAHGNITSPAARLPGPAMAAACGQAAVNTVLQDGTTPLENVRPTGTACKNHLT